MDTRRMRQKRRQRKKQIKRFAQVLLLLVLCLFLIKKYKPKEDKVSKTPMVTKEESTAEEKVEKQLSQEEMLHYIQKEKEIYPKDLREKATEYPETVEFVYRYPEDKNKTYPFIMHWYRGRDPPFSTMG